MRGFYGQKNAGTLKSILFIVIKKLFDKVEEWARYERVIDAFKRVEITIKRLKVAAEKLEKQEEIIRGNAIYAQVASKGIIEIYQGRNGYPAQAPVASLREEKRIIVRIPDDAQTKIIGK